MTYSFDPAVLQDQLLRILKRSPQTQPYVEHRVSEIIAQIMSIPIVRQLETQVEQLQQIIQQLQAEREDAGFVFQKKQDKLAKATNKLRDQRKQLQKEIEKCKQLQISNHQFFSQIELLKQENERIRNELKQTNSKYTQLYKQQQIKQASRSEIARQLKQTRNQLKVKQQSIKVLEQSCQKLKKVNKQIKYNQIKIKKQWCTAEQQLQQISIQINKYKSQLRVQKSQRQNQRKAMLTKINQLYSKCKNVTKANKKLNILSKANSQLRKQLAGLKSHFHDGIIKLQSEFRNVCNTIMDEIGQQFSNELKQLMAQLTKNKTQIRILREQAIIKDQIVQKLEKASSVQLMGNKELQKQLKSKKIQAESLRKQLKRNYEQSQVKYLGLEQSYRQILASTINIPIR